MNKKWTTILMIIVIVAFIGYVLYDMTAKKVQSPDIPAMTYPTANNEHWFVSKVFEPGNGQLNAVAVADNGNIILGGEPFIACYDSTYKLLWKYKTEMPVSAVTTSENQIYAAVEAIIIVLNMKGEKIDEWGPFEDNSIITSVSSNKSFVAFADAANKLVFVLDKSGVVKSLIGKSGEPFYIPSNYFDIALDSENNLFAANTGKRRIEKRNLDGILLSFFGEPGTKPGAFCGCCNPSHFALIPAGFVTGEKGINRITIFNEKGDFVEFVSSINHFIPALPLDIASANGKIIYGANPADSKLYVFKRK
jgi:hypothetical protein